MNQTTRLLELAIRGLIADNIPSALAHDVFHKSAFVASRAVSMKKIIRRSLLSRAESAYARVCTPRRVASRMQHFIKTFKFSSVLIAFARVYVTREKPAEFRARAAHEFVAGPLNVVTSVAKLPPAYPLSCKCLSPLAYFLLRITYVSCATVYTLLQTTTGCAIICVRWMQKCVTADFYSILLLIYSWEVTFLYSLLHSFFFVHCTYSFLRDVGFAS